MADYLLPIADDEALIWIVSEQRTALPRGRTNAASAVSPRDRVLLYTTRGCFHNPTRDRGRVMGVALALKSGKSLDDPVVFGAREYTFELRFQLLSLCPWRTGVELAPLVDDLATFGGSAWPTRLRRAIVRLEPPDGDTLANAVNAIAPRYPTALDSYLAQRPRLQARRTR